MTMLSWLDKPPYETPIPDEKNPYRVFSQCYVSLGIALATNAQRDTFAENPVEVIKKSCLKLADYSDTLIRDLEDPLILQPATLDIILVKKRPGESDFGLEIDSFTQPGIHVITEVRFGSLAYQCGRIRPGDEIIQINYQTVVGWSTKKFTEELNQENNLQTTDLVLTLKKMPKNLEGCGKLYIQAFPIPSKKQPTSFTRQQNEELAANELYVDAEEAKNYSIDLDDKSKDDFPDDDDDLDDIDDEIYLPTTSSTKDISPTQSVGSLLMRPRSTPIRRATISAGSPSKHRPYMNVSEIWAGSFDTTKSDRSNNSDGGSKQSSATSTMHSNDSGCATMYSSSVLGNQEFVSKSPARPITIGPEYINMASNNDDYINLYACKTSLAGKRDPPPPPPPPKQPIPKPRLNVSLSTSDEVKKKRPVPQPRSLASKSTSKLVSMTSEVHPVPSANVKIFKRYSSPLDPPLPSPPMTKNSSSSSSSDEDLPPALPARRPSAQSVKKGCPYYVSDVQKHDQNQ